jgi:hypothetical protein
MHAEMQKCRNAEMQKYSCRNTGAERQNTFLHVCISACINAEIQLQKYRHRNAEHISADFCNCISAFLPALLHCSSAFTLY